MFVPFKFSSVNSRADLASGKYAVRSAIYADRASRATLLLVTYSASGNDDGMRAADVVYTNSTGEVSACDYLLMPDLRWRDAAGRRHESLGQALGFASSFTLQREESYGFEHAA